MSRSTLLWMLAALAAAYWFLFREPIAAWQARKESGLQAAADANVLNGYTTYNSQIYTPALFQPIVRFFKAGSYVPATQNGNASGQQVGYSMQG